MANGFLAAVVFNLLYDFTLSKTVQWHTMCPIIDFINHRSDVEVCNVRIRTWNANRTGL